MKISIVDKIVYELCIETSKLLHKQQDKLRNIKWTDGESNLDLEYSELGCQCCRNAWRLYVQKKFLDEKIDMVCNTPDINITLILPDSNKVFKKIELKSSKNKKIPGSTIKNLDINQPIIYCLRPQRSNGDYKIRYSQYHMAMGESEYDLFQDRTPRPVVSFTKMKDIDEKTNEFEIKQNKYWMEHYAKCAVNRINCKNKINESWQDGFIKLVKKYIIHDYLKNKTVDDFLMDKTTLDIDAIKI